MAKFSIFLNILRPGFQNNFVPIFLMFSVPGSKMEHKKLLKTEHQCKNRLKLGKKKKI